MHNDKILVLGGNGQVGWELKRKLACLGQVTAVGSSEVDLSKPDSIRTFLQTVKPSVIVNAAAYTAVDKAETDTKTATEINSTAPGILAEAAKLLDAILIHYSTDYVFDGCKSEAYHESDAPNPINRYGQTKLAGDQAIQEVGGNYLILRTSWVYGARGDNFLLTMTRLAQERSELRIVNDQTGAPTSSECIAQATALILAQVLSPGGKGLDGRQGIYNLTSQGETTWFGFAKALLSQQVATHTLPKLIPISSASYPRPARRPANSRLCGDKLRNTFGVTLPDWEDALALVLETIAQSSLSPAHV